MALTSMNSGFKAPISTLPSSPVPITPTRTRRADGRVVAEVEAAQPAAGHGAGCHARLEKVAPCKAGAALLGGLFFRSQICHSSLSFPTQPANYCH